MANIEGCDFTQVQPILRQIRYTHISLYLYQLKKDHEKNTRCLANVPWPSSGNT